jgi:hypothetical protein
MPDLLSWSLNVEVAGGPKIQTSRSLQVTGYDKVEVVVPGQNSPASPGPSVEIQPADDAARVRFISITSDRYGENLTYTVTGGAENVVLDSAQSFAGAGAIGLLGAAPQTIVFTNGLGEGQNARITVLVGREAVEAVE